MRQLWKVVATDEVGRRLLSIVEAPDKAMALRVVEGMHFDLRLKPRIEVEASRVLVDGESLEVPVLPGMIISAGNVVQIEDEGLARTVILPPNPTMLEQLIPWFKKQPAPAASVRLDEAAIGLALARLAIRWGSYFAVIANRAKPTWAHAGEPVSHFGNQELARMNIEISANLDALYWLSRRSPQEFRHIIHASRLLPSPQASEDVLTCPPIVIPLESGVDALIASMIRDMQAVHPGWGKGLTASAWDKLVTPEVLAAFDINPSRRIMNQLALATWRSPMERFHGGQGVGQPLDVNRFTAEQLDSIEEHMAAAGNGFARTFAALSARKPAEVRQLLAPTTVQGEAGRKWSITEQTRAVILSG